MSSFLGSGISINPNESLVDEYFADVNGHFSWLTASSNSGGADIINNGYTLSNINNFGDDSGAAVPIANSNNPDYRSMYGVTFSGLNGVNFHGSTPWNAFGTNGVPARPDSDTSKWGLGFWSKRASSDLQLRIEQGLDIERLKYWYDNGRTTHRFSFKVYFPIQSGGSDVFDGKDFSTSSRNPANTNTSGGASNNFTITIADPAAQIIYTTSNVLWTPGGSNFQTVNFDITITSDMAKRLKKYGGPTWQLRLDVSGAGDLAFIVYSQEFRLT